MKPLQDLLSLEHKTAIVTGGAAGIGEAIVRRLHEAGARVVIADMNEETGDSLASELRGDREGSAQFISTDVSDQQAVNQLLAQTVDAFGGVDILVNNAGIFPFSALADMTSEEFQKVQNVNVNGVFYATKAVSERMKEQGHGGKIINITSIDALHPSMVGLAHYDASKHAVWGFTKNVALELAPHNITVNALAPGGVKTPGTAGLSDPSALEPFLKNIPMHRMGEADEIGKVTLFLASDMSSYMTGSQVVVDGGRLLS